MKARRGRRHEDPAPTEPGGRSAALSVLRGGAEPAALSSQVRLARLWLPLAIVGVVLLWQLVVVPAGAERFGGGFALWAQLLFYSILGPAATFATLDWIVIEVERRETAQRELAHLYTELQDSHALLSAIQKVTERFASATDLEGAMRAASEGIRDVTGARGVTVMLAAAPGTSGGLEQFAGLDAPHLEAARRRDRALHRGASLEPRERLAGDDVWVLSEALRRGGVWGGSLHAFYDAAPDGGQRESFRILASEFGAAAEAARARMRDLLTLIEVDRSIRAEGNLERLLATLLEQMMERADAPIGGVYLAEEGERLRLHVSHPGRAAGGALRLGEGWVGRTGARRAPRIAERLEPAERAGAPLLQSAASAAALPLVTEDALLGVVVLGHPEAGRFEADDLPFLELLAGQVSLAVRNARAYLHSEELAIAEERARIAREIHDGVAQSLAFSALKLDLVARLLDRDPDKARAELDRAKGTIREMIKEVRRSIFALRPVELERYGFVGTLERYARDFGQQNDVGVDLELGPLPDLDVKSEATLFRIFQEAMNNVAKHAAADRVVVRSGTDVRGWAFLEVRDDGRGFDPERVGDRVTSAGGLGLRQMRERIEARGGRFEVRSGPEGTAVDVALPA